MASSRLRLSEMAEAIDALLAEGNSLCPEKMPADGAVLTDSAIFQVFKDSVQASGLGAHPWLVDHMSWEQDWILRFAAGAMEDVKAFECFKDALQSGEFAYVLGIVFEDTVLYLDQFAYDVQGTIPLVLCANLPGVFGEMRPDRSAACLFGEYAGGTGTVIGALAPFLEAYRPEIFGWRGEEAVMKEIARFPLLAEGAAVVSPPGLPYNHFLGAAEKADDLAASEHVPWQQIRTLIREERIASRIARYAPRDGEVTPRWGVVQCLNTFQGGDR